MRIALLLLMVPRLVLDTLWDCCQIVDDDGAGGGVGLGEQNQPQARPRAMMEFFMGNPLCGC